MVCLGMKPQGTTVENLKLKAFPFSLVDTTREWLFYLPRGSITTWAQMARAFLDKYFPTSKDVGLRREICGIKQKDMESLYEFWERLLPMERKMMDAASGGAIVNKTPTQARTLIDTMAENSKQFGVRSDVGRGASQLTMGNMPQVKNSSNRAPDPFEHIQPWLEATSESELCPEARTRTRSTISVKRFIPAALAISISTIPSTARFQQQHQPKAPFQPSAQHQHQVSPQAPSSLGMSLEDVVKSMAANMVKFQQETQVSIQDLQATVGQLANKGKLRSQTETNPKANVSVVTLRNGKELQEVGRKKKEKVHKEEEELKVKTSTLGAKDVKEEEAKKKTPEVIVQAPPFLSQFEKTKRESEEKEILDTFRKVQVNIPLLDAIKEVPRYAKFLKELCTNKRKLKGNEKITMSQNVFAVLQKQLPPSCKDPGMFTIPCKVGNVSIKQVMLDLGASINVTPYAIYSFLDVGPLKPTGVVIQLADMSIVYPKGVLEDVLVQVNELVFPADFYVINMEEKNASKAGMLLLSRLFLKTSKTMTDVHSGSLTMEFDGEMIKFNIYDAMRYPSDVSSLCFVNIIESLSNTMFDLFNEDVLEVILDRDLTNGSLKKLAQEYKLEDDFVELVSWMEKGRAPKPRYEVSKIDFPISHTRLLPSVEQAPELELKTLPHHLKYAYLGDKKTLSVIISATLSPNEERELVDVLKEHKRAIGWTIVDIKGLSPSLCQHKILLEEEYKPFREVQRRLNPPMMEVVKKEILKLLDANMIYPISDSKWVSPV
ncbi:uncharacterized protein LOC112523882 [Cynara cardunculus var. scolymus]|uniref:uncharacterized protein LOC112523882 n=1 Tax=Cynara cardunculus var. scolymus TaxID=59895 RepID=UPI000D62F50B|nr:uncharacterized protein LOC112523882 [Cynara cardunculus var. scolymus]